MPADRPNFVYIVADQWRGDCLGLYADGRTTAGTVHPVMTPHLNQLASEGVLCSQAFADCPICMPQRVTMLTGRTGSQMRCVANFREHNRPAFDMARTLPARLAREAGYQTKAVGKMHFAPARSRYGFEHVTLHPDDYLWWLEERGRGGQFRGHGLGGNEVYPVTAVTDEPHYHTSWMIDQAVRFLDQREPDVPFCLFVVFEAPHSPFDPPAPFDRMYDNFTIPAPVQGDWADEPPALLQQRVLDKNLDQLPDEVIAETRRRYYGQISQIDYRLGLLLGALRQKGLDEDTAIVFTSDHGECLGDHGQFAKHCFLGSAARVPLILRLPPSLSDRPVAREWLEPVLTADICPTLLDLAGLTPDDGPEGRSLLDTLSEAPSRADLAGTATRRGLEHPPAGAQGRVVFGEAVGTACAIEGSLKYVWYAQGGREQLFHIHADPDDLHDLAADADHVDDVARLRTALTDYLAANSSQLVGDGALVAQDPSINPEQVRSRNPAACRGPMRGGMGY